MAAGYLEILRARHAARLLVGTLVGRLPNATAAIAVVLFVRAQGGSYSRWSRVPLGGGCGRGSRRCAGRIQLFSQARPKAQRGQARRCRGAGRSV